MVSLGTSIQRLAQLGIETHRLNLSRSRANRRPTGAAAKRLIHVVSPPRPSQPAC